MSLTAPQVGLSVAFVFNPPYEGANDWLYNHTRDIIGPMS
jgi:hypothetical protein